MKKTLTVITLLAGAVSGYSQGNISFDAYFTGGDKQAVYGVQTGTYAATYGGFTVNETVGSSPTTLTTAESPAGTVVYSGGALSGTGYSAELLVGPAGITSLSGTSSQNGASSVGLSAFGGTGSSGGSIAPFFTGNARHIGFINANQPIVLPTESYYGSGVQVSVAIAAWDNDGGLYPTLASAQAAYASGVAAAAWGISQVEQTTAAGGLATGTGNAMNLPTIPSFSLGVATPEPSTIALGVMGVSALLFRRRK